MCDHTIKNKTKNEIIKEKVGIRPIIEKLVETCLKWFGHIQKIRIEAPVHVVDQMDDNPIIWEGKNLRKLLEKLLGLIYLLIT